MKKNLLLLFVMGILFTTHAQNIDDNKISFPYIQLPLFHLDDTYTSYEVFVEHRYEQANQDSMLLRDARQDIAFEFFQRAVDNHQRAIDSLDRDYLFRMAQWETQTNNGVKQPNGQPLVQPSRGIYPTPPAFPRIDSTFFHSPLNDNDVKNTVKLDGYQQGSGEIKITVAMLPLQNVRIKMAKSGTGSSTKYTYTATYNLPIELTVETPRQGILAKLRILENQQNYSIGDYKSKYDYELFMLNSKDRFLVDLERSARTKAITGTRNYLNNQFGFVRKTRSAELYSVKRFKDYDYSDVVAAYTLTTQALQLVQNDRDRSGAISMIDKAIAAWNEVLFESNTYDSKARINDKITAMVQCNLAELMIWKADFQNAELNLNLAIGNGGKFKRHAEGEKSFLADQKKRWEVNQ